MISTGAGGVQAYVTWRRRGAGCRLGERSNPARLCSSVECGADTSWILDSVSMFRLWVWQKPTIRELIKKKKRNSHNQSASQASSSLKLINWIPAAFFFFFSDKLNANTATQAPSVGNILFPCCISKLCWDSLHLTDPKVCLWIK